MPVNQDLALLSDYAFRSAFLIYALALILSIAAYVAAGGTKPTSARTADKLSNMTQSLVWLGIIIHAGSVILRGVATQRVPWGNLYEYISVTAVLAMTVAAVVLHRRDLRILWTWVLVPILILLFYGGTKLYVNAGPVVPALRSFWLPIHVSTVSIGAGFGLISSLASILYLLRSRNPQGWLGRLVNPLPDAEKLDRLAYRAGIICVPVFGLGVALGAIWAESSWGRFWNWDPKETMSFVTWVLYAAYLHARATAGWRKAASWINVAAFTAMVFNLFFINLVANSLHSYAGLN
ncbi:c-type cytochrome biogenesis protein CcsB [Corynebacterium argentoratense]|uniref:c-type cytochrome biogenesis protein CcsB n=1 Tax=Corynebacterium argentoratense TaxID=42817 RepID=UPI001F1EBE8C|nr:c-type cytochrome biogenesis protein CcsB [Corynebacterium argentoratense]MCF1765512.1 c-type cytochrome biogenesis protein CcsB [Corynebacterium argentoratense]